MPEYHNVLPESGKTDPIEIFTSHWKDVLCLFPFLSETNLNCTYGKSTHFDSSRGYAVTRIEGSEWTIVLALKMQDLPRNSMIAILRHEIGHVVDFAIAADFLNGLAQKQGLDLPVTPERRADALAYLLWGDIIYYDTNDLQDLKQGISPRPERLGL